MPTGRVLVVDDEPLVLDLLHTALEAQGYTVQTANHPLLALSIVSQTRPYFDLLIADLRLPGMSGMDLARNVAGLSPHTAVVFISGIAPEFHPEVLPEGSAFLSKPFRVESLYLAVRSALMKPTRDAVR